VSLSSTLLKAPTKEARANVLGVGIHAVDLPRAVELIESAVLERQPGYVCVAGVHGVMEAQRNPEFRKILDEALLVVPDGMPTVWVGRAQGLDQIHRVFGPDLMSEICRRSGKNKFSHFLYGGKPGVAGELRSNLQRWYPDIQIVGTFTPPFRPLLPNEEADLEALMAQLKPDVIWVGLSTPKQERFMSDFLSRLSSGVMIGVGAAFDIHTGRLKDAPDWVKNAGLQWLHRLGQEPARLWKRYLVNNSSFLWRIFLQFSGLASYELPPR
jgi:N-acetylglucosaminyldiphosphoundecaprenol N-acetyl-beta-D-mannosaminyltransferase